MFPRSGSAERSEVAATVTLVEEGIVVLEEGCSSLRGVLVQTGWCPVQGQYPPAELKEE